MIVGSEVKPTENPYPKPAEHLGDSPELDEGDLHNVWNEGYIAGMLDVARVVAAYLRGEFIYEGTVKEEK